jgi:hypothetical protein
VIDGIIADLATAATAHGFLRFAIGLLAAGVVASD